MSEGRGTARIDAVSLKTQQLSIAKVAGWGKFCERGGQARGGAGAWKGGENLRNQRVIGGRNRQDAGLDFPGRDAFAGEGC